jgi:hypothetical protein
VGLLAEILIISGVAMDLVGAGVLSHAHNAESIAEIRAEIGAEKSAVGENDAIATTPSCSPRSASASSSGPSGLPCT